MTASVNRDVRPAACGYRRTKDDTGRIISALGAKLRQYPGEDDLANGEDWI